MKRIIIITFLIITASLLQSEQKQVIERFVDVAMIKEARAPIFTKDSVILTLPENTGYEIFIQTNLDEWSQPHYFHKNLYGIYYCVLKYKEEKKEFLYRLNINGYWSEDPMNNQFASDNYELVQDNYGNLLTRIRIPDQIKYYQPIPIIKEIENGIKEVTFRIHAPEAKSVNLLCSNLGFSSFSYKMGKVSDEFWEITLKLGKGTYSYFYSVDGKKVLDLENLRKTYDKNLGRLSVFSIP